MDLEGNVFDVIKEANQAADWPSKKALFSNFGFLFFFWFGKTNFGILFKLNWQHKHYLYFVLLTIIVKPRLLHAFDTNK